MNSTFHVSFVVGIWLVDSTDLTSIKRNYVAKKLDNEKSKKSKLCPSQIARKTTMIK
jgi:hypothetical protein